MFSKLGLLSSLTATLPSSCRSQVLKFLPVLSPGLTRGHKHLVTPTNFPQRNYEKKNPEYGRQEMAKDGYGVTLYDLEDGERKSLSAVVMRFKRLDWGAWIRPRAGRDKKKWKKDTETLINNEKHVFCQPYHKRRFDRAVTAEYKAVRHLPDDPYKVYNDLSWQGYHSVKLKNIERIKKYGAKNYNFPKHVAHYKKKVINQDKDYNNFYEPPGYHDDISSGIYTPDLDRPQDTMAPDYLLERRHQSQAAFYKERRYWRTIRRCEPFAGKVSNCSKLRLPVVGTRLG